MKNDSEKGAVVVAESGIETEDTRKNVNLVDVKSDFNMSKHGLDAIAKASLIGGEISRAKYDVCSADASVNISKGISIEGKTTGLNVKAQGCELTVGKAGGSLNLDKNGIEVGAEQKLFRVEVDKENFTIGSGFNMDTGFKVAKDGVKAELLGFGVSAGDDGFGFKLPFFDFKLIKKVSVKP